MESQKQSERQTCRVIVFGQNGSDVLLKLTETGFVFPCVEIPRWERLAENLTAALKRDWRCDAVCLFTPGNSSQDGNPNGHHYEVMECWRDGHIRGTDWKSIGSLTADSFRDEAEFQTLARCLQELDGYEHDPLSPFDSFRITYAPSATVFVLCHTRPENRSRSALVLGVPDSAAHFISDEVKEVAAAIPAAELFLSEKATATLLRSKGKHSRFIHIATHGYFRQDNPMFSGIHLGDGVLSLYDLYQLEPSAELVTLSGCATGLGVVADGDELLGLLRGLIHAGARAAMLTLWDVHDRRTAEFMTSLYRHLFSGKDRSTALREATLELRQVYPHPYYWAPFVLIGG